MYFPISNSKIRPVFYMQTLMISFKASLGLYHNYNYSAIALAVPSCRCYCRKSLYFTESYPKEEITLSHIHT